MPGAIDSELHAAVREARLVAGLTQEHLAAVSELSVRTVRNLELGTGPAPRRASLVRIAAALGMSPVQREDLLTRAGYADEPVTGNDPLLFGSNTEVGAVIRHNVSRIDWISVQLRTRVGADRVEELEEETRVMRARVDGVDGVYLICAADTGRYRKATSVGVSCIEDCEVVEVVQLPGPDLRVIRLGFGRVLARGELHSYRFRLDYPAGAGAGHRQRAITAGYGGNGFFRPTPLYAMRVQFDSADRPAECIQVFQSRPGRAMRDVRPIPLIGAAAQLILRDARPGTHGLRWSW
jgi:transcriptional regulator with XRE-family HTH domain